MTENEIYKSLDIKSQAILNVFVQSCLTLNIENINKLFAANPSLIKASEYDIMPFLERVNEIFNEFKENNSIISVQDSKCNGCTPGGLTKQFNVINENDPALNSNFGFLITIENNRISEISECTQYKSYQKRLNERLFGGLNEEEIRERKQAVKNLPDIFNK